MSLVSNPTKPLFYRSNLGRALSISLRKLISAYLSVRELGIIDLSWNFFHWNNNMEEPFAFELLIFFQFV